MDDLKTWFSLADDIDAPDLWSEVEHRSRQPHPTRDRAASPPAWKRPVTIVVAFAVFGAAAVFAWRILSPVSDRQDQPIHQSLGPPAPSESDSVRVDLSSLPVGWTQLPDAPPDVRSNAATEWTGRALLVWGGYVYTGFSNERALDDGYSFDPSTGETGLMARSPLIPRVSPATAWTGEEFLIWGGTGLHGPSLTDGAAYDPARDSWRELPEAPIGLPRAPRGQTSMVSAWTGRELLVWSTVAGSGAAYDPESDSWRAIASAPISLGSEHTIVWAGEEILALGTLQGGSDELAAYDPGSDTWTALASPPEPFVAATWTGSSLVAWTYEGQSASFDPSEARWTPLPDVPVSYCDGGPSELLGSGTALGRYCNEFVELDPGRNVWHNVTPTDFTMTTTSSFVDDGTFFIAAYGAEYAPGAPVSLYAYVPPDSFVCGGFGDLAGEDLARAIVARLSLLRQDRPQDLVYKDYAILVSLRGSTEFGGGGLASRPFSGNYIDAQIRGVDDLGDGSYRVLVTTQLGAGGEFSEQMILRPTKNLYADECPLVVDEVDPVDLGSRFVPEYERVGDQAVSVSTFADGSSAEVSVPVSLRPFLGGVQTHASLVVRDAPAVRYPITFLHGSMDSTLLLSDGIPEATYTAPDGRFATGLRGRDGSALMAFELPDWTVVLTVPGGVPPETLFESIETSQVNGFPVVKASGPVALAEGFGEGEGPQITFADVLGDGLAELSPEGCSTGEEIAASGLSGSACLGDGNVFLNVQGRAGFVKSILRDLKVISFTPGP